MTKKINNNLLIVNIWNIIWFDFDLIYKIVYLFPLQCIQTFLKKEHIIKNKIESAENLLIVKLSENLFDKCKIT